MRQISDPSVVTTQSNVATADVKMLGVPLLDSSDSNEMLEVSPDELIVLQLLQLAVS